MLTSRGFLRRAAASALATGVLSAFSVIPTPASAETTAAQMPNILFVLMDNLGYGEVGAYGGGVLSPSSGQC